MSSLPWHKIQFEDGVETVYVAEEHLSDFPRFIHFILLQKVGLSSGVFKIRVIGVTASQSKVDSLCHFVNSYLAKIVPPRTPGEAETCEEASPMSQKFFSGSHQGHVYGFQQTVCSPVQFKNYLRKASNRSTFSTGVAKCCSLYLLSGQALAVSTDKLEQHYWNVIESVSSKSDALTGNVSNVYIRNLLEEGAKKKNLFYGCSESDVDQVPSPAYLLRKRNLTKESILYCSGIPLKDKCFPIIGNFSLSKLGTILDLFPEAIPGITYPYIYVGRKHSTFPWHIEDQALFSINALHAGAPCVWFFVPPSHFRKFAEVAKFFTLDPGQVSCFMSLLHKYLLASKEYLMQFGIPVSTVIQREGDIIVTYPFASHAGFKMGWNLQEAANFADPWWVEPALFVPPCVCLPTSFNMDLKEIIAAVRPHLLELYIRRDFISIAKAVAGNDFLKILGLLPPLTHPEPKILEERSEKCKEEGRNEEIIEEEEEANEGEKQDVEAKLRVKGSRFTLQCPQQGCPKTLEGGRGKRGRMVQHIKIEHADCFKLLFDKFNAAIPAREIKSSFLLCPFCNQKRAGNQCHLNMHIRRMHKNEK